MFFNCENILNFYGPGIAFNIKEKDLKHVYVISGVRRRIVKMIYLPMNETMAVKSVYFDRFRLTEKNEEFIREMNRFYSMKSKNFVRIFGVLTFKFEYLICTEVMDTSLQNVHYNYLNVLHRNIPEEFLYCVIVLVLDAFKDCKRKSIQLPIIKMRKILMDKSGTMKLCAFGEVTGLLDTPCMSVRSTNDCIKYFSPEQFELEEIKVNRNKTATWNLGLLLMEILLGDVPYKDKTNNVPQNLIMLKSKVDSLDVIETVENTFKDDYSDELKTFVKDCLEKNAEKRPNFEELSKTEFVKHAMTINAKRNDIVKNILFDVKLDEE